MELSNYRFTKTHEWVTVRDGLAYIGITDHAQEEITDVVYVELPTSGSAFTAGDELLLVDSVKSSFSIYAPIGGTVKAVNQELETNPQTVNESPYENGWMVALVGFDSSELDTLMTESEYNVFVESGG